MPFTTPGFQGEAEPFPCRDIARSRVRRCPQTLLLSQHLPRCSQGCPALLHLQQPLGAEQPLGWHMRNPRELARERGRLRDHCLCVSAQ